MRRTFIIAGAFVALSLTGCAAMSPRSFAGATPQFQPEKFFTGPVRSWGVIENRRGDPRSRFTTHVVGVPDGNGIVLTQHFDYEDGHTADRIWHVRRVDENHYDATASDVIGVARGEAWGNTFRWEYTLAVNPKNPLTRVHMSHWMYLQNPDTMVNRVTVSKLGVILAEITETFERGEGPVPSLSH